MEYVKQFRMEGNNSIRGCYTFGILQHVNYIINNMQLLDQDLRTFGNGFEAQSTVFIVRVRSSLLIMPFGPESKLGSRL